MMRSNAPQLHLRPRPACLTFLLCHPALLWAERGLCGARPQAANRRVVEGGGEGGATAEEVRWNLGEERRDGSRETRAESGEMRRQTADGRQETADGRRETRAEKLTQPP